MKNIIIKNGLLGSVIVCLVMIGMTMYMKANPENEPNAFIGFISMMIAFIFLILGIKQTREANDGVISFGKAFTTGILITLIMSTIYVLVWLVIYYNFFPNFIEQYGDMVLKNAKPEDLADKTEQVNMMKEAYKNPLLIIFWTYVEIFPLGFIVSLIAAFIMKRSK